MIDDAFADLLSIVDIAVELADEQDHGNEWRHSEGSCFLDANAVEKLKECRNAILPVLVKARENAIGVAKHSALDTAYVVDLVDALYNATIELLSWKMYMPHRWRDYGGLRDRLDRCRAAVANVLVIGE
jgi:hypothetical protein